MQQKTKLHVPSRGGAAGRPGFIAPQPLRSEAWKSEDCGGAFCRQHVRQPAVEAGSPAGVSTRGLALGFHGSRRKYFPEAWCVRSAFADEKSILPHLPALSSWLARGFAPGVGLASREKRDPWPASQGSVPLGRSVRETAHLDFRIARDGESPTSQGKLGPGLIMVTVRN